MSAIRFVSICGPQSQGQARNERPVLGAVTSATELHAGEPVPSSKRHSPTALRYRVHLDRAFALSPLVPDGCSPNSQGASSSLYKNASPFRWRYARILRAAEMRNLPSRLEHRHRIGLRRRFGLRLGIGLVARNGARNRRSKRGRIAHGRGRHRPDCPQNRTSIKMQGISVLLSTYKSVRFLAPRFLNPTEAMAFATCFASSAWLK